MRKILILLTILLLSSCAPTAKYMPYDIYSYHPYVYGEDGVNDIPPLVIFEGESWVQYAGKVKRVYRPRKKFGYNSTVVVTDKYNYERYYNVKGKSEITNQSRCYLMMENDMGIIRRYLIINQRRYSIDN